MAKTPIEALSGGQFQRMLFARVMVQQAPLVMLDEPFTGIDEATSRELMELILEMHQQGQTIWRCCMITSGWPTFSGDAAANPPARLLGPPGRFSRPSARRGLHDLAHLLSAFH
jgi:zinc/manganese transport system ATP-binding protein